MQEIRIGFAKLCRENEELFRRARDASSKVPIRYHSCCSREKTHLSVDPRSTESTFSSSSPSLNGNTRLVVETLGKRVRKLNSQIHEKNEEICTSLPLNSITPRLTVLFRRTPGRLLYTLGKSEVEG